MVSFWNCFSQNDYPDAPKEYQKIHFVYEQKSNYFINQNGVYADTLLLSFDFPTIKYMKAKSPTNQNQMVGFIPYGLFYHDEDKRKLISSIYHNTQTYEGVYDIKKDKTIIRVKREQKCEAFQRVSSYLKEKVLPDFRYRIEINYKKETIGSYFPNTSWNCCFEKEKNIIIFNANTTSGYYKEVLAEAVATNLILLNRNLNNKIVPGLVFVNNDFGVEKIKTLFSIYELKSVTYE